MSREGLFPSEGVDGQAGVEEGIIFSEDESEDEGVAESVDVLLRWGMVHGDGDERKRGLAPFREEERGAEATAAKELTSVFGSANDDWTDEEGDDGEESRRVRRRPVDKAWPRVRTTDNRNWAR